MIDISSYRKILAESSSKGNQEKYFKDNMWVKLDTHGYEGLAEEFSTLIEQNIQGLYYIPYKSDVFLDSYGNVQNGCYSYSAFDLNRYCFISFRRLLRMKGRDTRIFYGKSIKQSFLDVQNFILQEYGLDVGQYMATALLLDSVILNEDRHPMNLCVIYDRVECKYLIAPIFDNGMSFLSFLKQYNNKRTLEENVKRAEAKPFTKFYNKQVDMIRELGYAPLQVNYNGLNLVMNQYNNPIYDILYVNRVKDILNIRLREMEDIAYVFY